MSMRHIFTMALIWVLNSLLLFTDSYGARTCQGTLLVYYSQSKTVGSDQIRWALEWCSQWEDGTRDSKRLAVEPIGYHNTFLRFFREKTSSNGTITRYYAINNAQIPHVILVTPSSWYNFCECTFAKMSDQVFASGTHLDYTDEFGWALFNPQAGGSDVQDVSFLVIDFTIPIVNDVYDQFFNIHPNHALGGFDERVLPSTDCVNLAGLTPSSSGWSPDCLCESTLADGVYLTAPIKLNLDSPCADLDGWDRTDLLDAVHHTPPLKGGYACFQDPDPNCDPW